MHRRRYLFAVFCVMVTILGCGDTPRVVLRDVLTTWNELADLMYTIPDDPETAEEFAGDLIKKKLEPLKKKWEAVEKRVGKLQKLEKEQREELEEYVVDRREEAEFTLARLSGLASAQGRLRSIMAKVQATGKQTPNLQSCLAMLGQYKLSLPSDQKKLPKTEKYGKSWTLDIGPGGGGGRPGVPGMPGMGGRGGPGGMPPGGMPPGM